MKMAVAQFQIILTVYGVQLQRVSTLSPGSKHGRKHGLNKVPFISGTGYLQMVENFTLDRGFESSQGKIVYCLFLGRPRL